MGIVAYKISAQDNDSYMLPFDSDWERCQCCGYRKEFFPHSKDFQLKIKKYDISITYDGQWIISKKMALILEKECLSNFSLRSFATSDQFLHLIPKKTIEFDYKRRKTRFINYCDTCGNYESITGATPSFLKVNGPLEHGLYASDLFFGSGNEKHNLLFVSESLKDEFLRNDLQGIDYQTVSK